MDKNIPGCSGRLMAHYGGHMLVDAGVTLLAYCNGKWLSIDRHMMTRKERQRTNLTEQLSAREI